MKRTKKIIFSALIIFILIMSMTCKSKDKDIYRDEALYVDPEGVTRFDPLKVKIGDMINEWKVINVDIKKLNENKMERYYRDTPKKSRKDYSAEVVFGGKVEVRGIYNFFTPDYPFPYYIAVDFDLSVSDNRGKLFPRLNYKKQFDQMTLFIEDDEKINMILSENKGFVEGIKGEATFVIDRYTITHVDNDLSVNYGSIHVTAIKDIKIIKGYDEALKEQQAKENAAQ